MKTQLSNQRSCTKTNRSASQRSAGSRKNRRSRVRRLLLAALISGTTFWSATSTSAAAGLPFENRGGISILVHEFTPTPSESKNAAIDNAATTADAKIASVEKKSNKESAPEANTTEDHIADAAPATIAVGTHDSIPDVVAAETPLNVAAHRTSNQFNEIIAAAVSASAAKVGISVEQFLEPFAMVGPLASKPLATTPLDSVPANDAELASEPSTEVAAELATKPADQIADQPIEPVLNESIPSAQQLAEAVALNRWWLDESTPAPEESEPIAKAEAAIGSAIADASEMIEDAVTAEVEIASVEVASEAPQSDELAVDETAAAESVDDSEAVSESAVSESVEIASTAADMNESAVEEADDAVDHAPLVGSAALIVTIPEAYSPYDIAQRDLELEYLNLSTVQPITPKNYVTMPATDELALEDEESLEYLESVAPADLPPAEFLAEDASAAIEIESDLPASEAATTEFAIAEEADVAEPAVNVSPECLLDEWVHTASDWAEKARATDLTFASLGNSIGESVGDWLASLTPDEIAPQADEVPTMIVANETIPAPVPDAAPNAAPAEQLVAEEAIDETATPEATEIAAAEIVTMDVDGEKIPAPVADDAPNAATLEQLAVEDVAEEAAEEAIDETVAPEATEIAAAEIVTMDIDGEKIPAPVADDAPNAATLEQLAVEDVAEEAAEEAARTDANEVAIAEVVMMEVVADVATQPVTATDSVIETELVTATEATVAPDVVVDAEPATAPVEQIATAESVENATPSAPSAKTQQDSFTEKMSISAMIAAINKWQNRTIAEILAAGESEASPAEAPEVEIADVSEANDATLVR
ncbi:hypothetical protein [Rhodopirellula sp. SWK7]|uniref:hypothetical protein n=1 Tax=Rhodopirellula sp. SWK7 TaxID=595460 RepID=UPI001360B175|nr:hypothetical protein [Rhodopirellula sp. SWK7]